MQAILLTQLDRETYFLNEAMLDISDYDFIQGIEEIIIRFVKKYLGEFTPKTNQCIQASMLEIKELAGEMVNDLKECVKNGGNVYACFKEVLELKKYKLKM